ncbi:MAG: hypothetical protein HFJ28_07065 [Clostridia bacterium]|nr:hypothetical protein [Clostridia bacterium]
MEFIAVICLLVFIIFVLVALAVMQIRMAGIKIKDFMGFIQANEMLDKLHRFSRRYKIMSPQEQIIFLAEAEKVFDAYDKIPSIVWEDEYRKYSEVLQAYQNIRMTRWSENQNKK